MVWSDQQLYICQIGGTSTNGSAHPGVPTALDEVIKQHAYGPREAPFASTPQVCILRRNWIIFPGLLRAIIREPLQLPTNPATALVRGSYRYTSDLVYRCTNAPVYRCARVLVCVKVNRYTSPRLYLWSCLPEATQRATRRTSSSNL